MAWERELEVLEEAIRRLSAEYDAFLYGTALKPPVETRKRVNEMIRRLSGVSFDAAAERYRFGTIQGRYTTLCERWERLQGEKEAGRRPGLYGHFTPGTGGAHPPSAASGPNARPSRSVEGEDSGLADRQLFEKYLRVRTARGESVEGYDYGKFADSLNRERARLKERLGTEDLVFEVAERDGKVKLIAKRSESGGAAASGEKK